MRIPLPLVLAVVAISAVNVKNVFAEQEVHEIHTPLVAELVNPCNGFEIVTISGTVTTLVQENVSDSGNSQISTHSFSKGDGVAAVSGTNYTYSEEFNGDVIASGASMMTQILNHRLTSAGSSDNFFFSVRLHFTMTPNGVPTAMVDRFEAGCRG